MKVAIGTKDGVAITEHFGYAREFQIWDVSGPAPRLVTTRRNAPACGAERHPGRESPMDTSVALVADCQAVVAARIGECAVERLTALGILAFESDDQVATALQELLQSDALAVARSAS
jgi:predicted Fe-Mo cluster-binding NifX family protein